MICRRIEIVDGAIIVNAVSRRRDGDGRISTREFQDGAAHVFLSQDPADPGTGMLGLA